MTTTHKKTFILCYDIRDPKRLRRVHQLVSQQLIQLQYSIYYGTATYAQIDALIAKLKPLLNHQDDVRIYESQPLEHAFIKPKHTCDIWQYTQTGDPLP